MFDDAEIGRRGWHLLQLGLILAAVMGAVIWMMDLLPAIRGQADTAFRGTSEKAWLMLLGLGAVGLTGVAAVIGAVRMITGRSSRATTLAMLILLPLGILFVLVAVADALPGALAEMRNDMAG